MPTSNKTEGADSWYWGEMSSRTETYAKELISRFEY